MRIVTLVGTRLRRLSLRVQHYRAVFDVLRPYAGGIAAAQAGPEHEVERQPLARPERPPLFELGELLGCPGVKAVATQALDLDAGGWVGLDVLARQRPSSARRAPRKFLARAGVAARASQDAMMNLRSQRSIGWLPARSSARRIRLSRCFCRPRESLPGGAGAIERSKASRTFLHPPYGSRRPLRRRLPDKRS